MTGNRRNPARSGRYKGTYKETRSYRRRSRPVPAPIPPATVMPVKRSADASDLVIMRKKRYYGPIYDLSSDLKMTRKVAEKQVKKHEELRILRKKIYADPGAAERKKAAETPVKRAADSSPDADGPSKKIKCIPQHSPSHHSTDSDPAWDQPDQLDFCPQAGPSSRPDTDPAWKRARKPDEGSDQRYVLRLISPSRNYIRTYYRKHNYKQFLRTPRPDFDDLAFIPPFKDQNPKQDVYDLPESDSEVPRSAPPKVRRRRLRGPPFDPLSDSEVPCLFQSPPPAPPKVRRRRRRARTPPPPPINPRMQQLALDLCRIRDAPPEYIVEPVVRRRNYCSKWPPPALSPCSTCWHTEYSGSSSAPPTPPPSTPSLPPTPPDTPPPSPPVPAPRPVRRSPRQRSPRQ